MNAFQYQDAQLRVANVGYSTAAQNIAAATRTYITGSAIPIAYYGLHVGQILRWSFNVYKLAAGIAASTYDVCVGTTGTTADAAVLSFTKPAGTAAIDEAWVTITCTIRSLGATGSMVGNFVMVHNLASTGHATIPCVCVYQAGIINTTTDGLKVGVCLTSGASDLITIQQVVAEIR